VISRRTHIDLLRRTGIWERMAVADREAMMIADGQWTAELIEHISAGLEPLRILRWVLRIDYFLPLIGRAAAHSYQMAHEIIMNPERVLNANMIIDEDALGTARKAAEEYFYRCAAESISRGYHDTDREQIKLWADEVSDSLAGKQGEDLLIGAKLVSEASATELSQAMTLARTRMNFLEWIEALVSGSASPEEIFSFPMEPHGVSTAPIAQDMH
jgi:hypothetical protein